MSRAVVAFPGRGAYAPASLGSLAGGHPWVGHADELRRSASLPPLSELDGAQRFEPALHLRPMNAWPLVFLAGLLDAERIAGDHEVVAVVASSTGWYTALAAAGVLRFDDAFRLVHEMARAAEEPLAGGERPAEIIYPLNDAAWSAVPARAEAVRTAVASADGGAARSSELGAFTVVAGTEPAVDRIMSGLPPVTLGNRDYPLRLASGDAWHTPLRGPMAARAGERLGDVEWHAPNVSLVDARGARLTPWSTDTEALARETLVEHPVRPDDFATAFRVALREYAPDVVLLPGPGTSLGSVCAQLIVAEGYRGLRTRADFEAAQGAAQPILLSMRR